MRRFGHENLVTLTFDQCNVGRVVRTLQPIGTTRWYVCVQVKRVADLVSNLCQMLVATLSSVLQRTDNQTFSIRRCFCCLNRRHNAPQPIANIQTYHTIGSARHIRDLLLRYVDVIGTHDSDNNGDQGRRQVIHICPGPPLKALRGTGNFLYPRDPWPTHESYHGRSRGPIAFPQVQTSPP